jgi:predicted GNAT superfamily acetyltransferase
LLSVSQKVGGLVAGAFSDAGDLVGFVFGLTGLRGGRIVHWSHMLAVDPDYRDRGVGRRLKLYQRECLRAAGVDRMYWSFDPLVARNAHLNLNRLGVLVEDYVTDMYADTGSDLHAFGTDRFVASWPVAGALQSEYMIAGDDLEPPLWEGGTSS